VLRPPLENMCASPPFDSRILPIFVQFHPASSRRVMIRIRSSRVVSSRARPSSATAERRPFCFMCYRIASTNIDGLQAVGDDSRCGDGDDGLDV